MSSTSAFPHERLLLKAQNLSAVPLHNCGLLLVPVPVGWAMHELLWASFSFGFIAAEYAQFGLCSHNEGLKSPLAPQGTEAEMVMAPVALRLVPATARGASIV